MDPREDRSFTRQRLPLGNGRSDVFLYMKGISTGKSRGQFVPTSLGHHFPRIFTNNPIVCLLTLKNASSRASVNFL